MKCIHSDLRRVTGVNAEFSDYCPRGFITSTFPKRSLMLLSALQTALLPLLLKFVQLPVRSFPTFQSQKAFYIVYSLSQHLEQATVAFTAQPNVTQNAVDRQYAMQTSRGLRHGVMQLLLWEQWRKTSQLSGLKSWAINSSFNYPEQDFVNVCK